MFSVEKAKSIMENGNYLCVLYKDETIYASNQNGLKMLMYAVKNNIDLNGFSAVDSLVGKASALLYAYLGVRNVCCESISENAVPVFVWNKVMFDTENVLDKKPNDIDDFTVNAEYMSNNVGDPDELAEKILKLSS